MQTDSLKKNDPTLPEQRTEPQERTRLFDIGLIPPHPQLGLQSMFFFQVSKNSCSSTLTCCELNDKVITRCQEEGTTLCLLLNAVQVGEYLWRIEIWGRRGSFRFTFRVRSREREAMTSHVARTRFAGREGARLVGGSVVHVDFRFHVTDHVQNLC